MAVGSGAPPVNSETEKLELGRTLDAVPSELVVVRLEVREDEIDCGGAVPDDVPISEVLLSSEVVSCIDKRAEDGAEADGALDDGWGMLDAEEGTEAAEDETGPTKESAALLEGGATLDEGTAELLGAGGWLEGGWLEGGCEDSLGDDSRVALLGSCVALLDAGVSLLGSGDALEVADGDEEGALLELGG